MLIGHGFKILVAAVLALLVGSGELLAAGGSSLQWNRPAAQTSQAAVGQPEMMTDHQVMAAAWEEDDAQVAQHSEDDRDRRSILVRQSVDPDSMWDDSEIPEIPGEPRIARLPDNLPDPFDEPEDDFLPKPEDDLEAVESAIESEQESREGAGEDASDSASDPFGEEAKELPGEVEMPAPDDVEPKMAPGSQTPDWKEQALSEREPVEPPVIVEPFEPEGDAELREQLKKERLQSETVCREEAAKIKASGIDTIDLNIRVSGNAGEDFPFTCSIDPHAKKLTPRNWPQVTYHWKASGLCHKPLYFEQVQLERSGHSWGPYVQPIMSGAHFFGTLPVLPYKMGLKTPGECVYTLGHYRPGNCAPQMLGGVPFSWRAVLFQGGAATGMSFIFP